MCVQCSVYICVTNACKLDDYECLCLCLCVCAAYMSAHLHVHLAYIHWRTLHAKREREMQSIVCVTHSKLSAHTQNHAHKYTEACYLDINLFWCFAKIIIVCENRTMNEAF